MDFITVSHDFLFYFFVTLRKLFFDVFLPRKITNLAKNNYKFQVRCTSSSKRSEIFRQNPLKIPLKKLHL